VRKLLAAMLAGSMLVVGAAACDDNKSGSNYAPPSQRQAQNTPPSPQQTAPSPPATPPTVPDTAQPPKTAPGAGPSAARLVGTWSVSESKGGPADSTKGGDRTEATTYRFEEGGRVTVAGSKQCAYTMQEMELKVDCNGQITAGKVEFTDNQTMVWTVAGNQTITLKKR
jgi:hypothetical protein